MNEYISNRLLALAFIPQRIARASILIIVCTNSALASKGFVLRLLSDAFPGDSSIYNTASVYLTPLPRQMIVHMS